MRPFVVGRLGHVTDAFASDPHAGILRSLVEGRIHPPAIWMTRGGSLHHPPAFVPILHDSSGTAYGMWRHLGLTRAPCFVAISNEESQAKEVARTVQQLWTFLALLAKSSDAGTNERLLTFLDGTGVTLSSVERVSSQVGDESDRFCEHPLALQDAEANDGQFPVVSRPDTWGLACAYEIGVDQLDERAPVWLRQPGPAAFEQQDRRQFWPGVWLSLNSPDWSRQEAIDAAQNLSSRYPVARDPFLFDWIAEAEWA